MNDDVTRSGDSNQAAGSAMEQLGGRSVQGDAKPLPVAVLLSGSGRTMENLAEAIDAGKVGARITQVISSNAQAFGLVRAAQRGLACATLVRADFASDAAYSEAVFGRVRASGARAVCLAGFLKLLVIPDDFSCRVVNVHPSLLPSFGEHGMYGTRVHEAVIAAGCKVTGCTVHFCDNSYDTGPIILQRVCPVLDGDDATSLAARVFEEECKAVPEAVDLLARGCIEVVGKVTRIRKA